MSAQLFSFSNPTQSNFSFNENTIKLFAQQDQSNELYLKRCVNKQKDTSSSQFKPAATSKAQEDEVIFLGDN